MSLLAFNANPMNPDQTAPLRSSLIRVQRVCFHDNSILKSIWKYAADVKNRQNFQDQKYWRHCVVSLSKNINPSLVLVQPRKTLPFITERLLMGRKESNKQTKFKVHLEICSGRKKQT